MKNYSKIEITDLSNKVADFDLKSLSDVETVQIVGGKPYSSIIYSRAFIEAIKAIRAVDGVATERRSKD